VASPVRWSEGKWRGGVGEERSGVVEAVGAWGVRGSGGHGWGRSWAGQLVGATTRNVLTSDP
jgi:hypothetical protein